MPPRLRIASISMASAAAVGLCVAIGVAPPATAEPCTGAAAAVQPPETPNAGETPSLPTTSNRRPIGQRPRNANEGAPLPRLGLLPKAILNAFTPRSAQVQQQAEVVPAPNPPGAGTQPVPNANQQVPPAAAAQPAPAPAAPPSPPGTSLVGWVTGPTAQTTRSDVSPSPAPISGSCGTTAIPAAIRCSWPSATRTAIAASAASNGGTTRCSAAKTVRWRRPSACRMALCPTNSRAHRCGPRVFPNRSSTAPIGRHRRRESFPPPASPPEETEYMYFMSIKSWDNNGAWTTNFSAIAVSPDNGEHWGVYPGTVRAHTRQRPGSPLHTGGREFPTGGVPSARSQHPYLYLFGTPLDAVVRRTWREFPRALA